MQGQNQQLDALSRIDALTGLANRRHWQDGAETLLHARHAHSRPATLLLMDIDLFKAINDEHGHIAGDDVLCSIADLIRHSVGPAAQTGRLGGDEFAIALPGTQADAEIVAERLRRGVQALSLTQAPELRCSVSIGLAEATAAEHTCAHGSKPPTAPCTAPSARDATAPSAARNHARRRVSDGLRRRLTPIRQRS
ncbi:diguanylate cyclase, partial [mine drainage metagenome]